MRSYTPVSMRACTSNYGGVYILHEGVLALLSEACMLSRRTFEDMYVLNAHTLFFMHERQVLIFGVT